MEKTVSVPLTSFDVGLLTAVLRAYKRKDFALGFGYAATSETVEDRAAHLEVSIDRMIETLEKVQNQLLS